MILCKSFYSCNLITFYLYNYNLSPLDNFIVLTYFEEKGLRLNATTWVIFLFDWYFISNIIFMLLETIDPSWIVNNSMTWQRLRSQVDKNVYTLQKLLKFTNWLRNCIHSFNCFSFFVILTIWIHYNLVFFQVSTVSGSNIRHKQYRTSLDFLGKCIHTGVSVFLKHDQIHSCIIFLPIHSIINLKNFHSVNYFKLLLRALLQYHVMIRIQARGSRS